MEDSNNNEVVAEGLFQESAPAQNAETVKAETEAPKEPVKPEAPKDDRFAAKFAALTRKEREVRDREKQAEKRLAEAEKKAQELEERSKSSSDYKETLKKQMQDN